jgi:hypothetical protein
MALTRDVMMETEDAMMETQDAMMETRDTCKGHGNPSFCGKMFDAQQLCM